VWRGGEQGQPALLASCYRRSLELAADADLESIAFPGISTGIYGYPMDGAAHIAVETVRDFLQTHERPARVVFCTFGAQATEAISDALASAT
jgi:O-acetyl-ADP-ribose deacetylase (regulator of RNase III)